MSSHGSCAAWSVASLMEKCPASPSPVCSPSAATADGGGRQAGRGQYRACKSPESTHSDDVFYSQVSTELHSSAPRFQSSSDMNARNSTSRLDTGSGRKRRSNARDSGRKSFCVATAPSLRHVKPGRRSGVSAILEREKEANCHMRRSVTLVGAPRFSACSRRSARNNSFSDAEEHRGQLSVLGEEDEEPEERDWRKRNQFMLGSAPAVRRKSHHLCHASVCSPSADCMAQSGFGGDLERNTYSAWEDEGVDAPPPRMSAVVRQTGRAKLLEWKETRTREVLDKLKKKEAEISDWEMRETSKAKKEMKKVEEKMEKKRSTAMENMQRKIMETQRKAEQKKCQARQAAVKKMTEVEKACDKVGTTGRLTWKPLFSF